MSFLNNETIGFIAGDEKTQKKIIAKLRKLFDNMMKTLFHQKGAQLDITILETENAQEFIEEHASVLNSSFKEVAMSDIMRQRLEESNYIFSGMKTFHELNEAFPSLLDENGNRKPFEQFLNDVRKIDSKYNSNYLRAEYNFVNSSAVMAAKWEEFKQYGDRYYLQYRTVGDKRVRPEHAALNRVTLPISDSFWETFFPPNGWNCRCTVVQVRKSKYEATDHDEAMSRGDAATGKDTRGLFRFNPGMQQKAMPDYNPYTIQRCRDCDIAKGKFNLAKPFIPDNEVCAACEILHKCAADKAKSQRAIERTHYLHEMETLLTQRIKKEIDEGILNIGFTKEGNKHLYSDTFIRTHVVPRDELKNLAKYLENAEYIESSTLTHSRKDNLVLFYYFKVKINGSWVRLNVAKKVETYKNGRTYTSYFLYSINDILE